MDFRKSGIDDSAFETWDDLPESKIRRISSDKFFSSRAWLQIRGEVLREYGRKCMKCGDEDGIIQVDHIKPRFFYPKLSLHFNNLQVLCRDCNLEKGVNTVDYRPFKINRYSK